MPVLRRAAATSPRRRLPAPRYESAFLTRAGLGGIWRRIVAPGCGEGEPWVLYHIVILIFGARPVLRPAPEPRASASGKPQTALRGQAGVSGRRIEQLCADL